MPFSLPHRLLALLVAALGAWTGWGQTCVCPPVTGGASIYGPQPSITCPAGALSIAGGSAALQAAIAANPGPTTFCLTATTHLWTSAVTPKPGNTFVGQYGAILDGQGTVPRGLTGVGGESAQGGQPDVVVQNLTLTRFTDVALQMGWRWTVRNTDLRLSRVGVAINSFSTLDTSTVHHNTQYGIVGGPGTTLTITRTEVSVNNTAQDCGGACAGDAGGSKIVGSTTGTTGLIWRDNAVHDNTGHGIWSDGNVRALYEGNVVADNSGAGIFHELAWDATIRQNTLTNNDREAIGRSCFWGAQIHLNTSSNVEVYSNTIVGTTGTNGICAVGADRADAVAPYPTDVSNLFVHDNTIGLSGTATTGLVGTLGTNNRFVHNAYHVASLTGAYWIWPTTGGNPISWSVWQAIPQDATGTLSQGS